MLNPTLVDLPVLEDPYGSIGVIEGPLALPFEVKRFYFITGVPEGATRGSHAHKNLVQLIVALSGSVAIDLDDASEVERFTLDRPSLGLLVPPGYWRTLRDFGPGTVLGVLASLEYDESDYIRSYRVFREWTHA